MFKQLTVENFLERDPVFSVLVLVDHQTGSIERTTPQYWAEVALSLELGSHVPRDVNEQFEAARALVAYSYFFYPFFTLAMELSMRVAESAVKHRCAQLSSPPQLNFHNAIEWLHANGHLSNEQKDGWHTIRDLRNESLHSDKQMIIPPAIAIPWLEKMIKDIDTLFNKSSYPSD